MASVLWRPCWRTHRVLDYVHRVSRNVGPLSHNFTDTALMSVLSMENLHFILN